MAHAGHHHCVGCCGSCGDCGCAQHHLLLLWLLPVLSAQEGRSPPPPPSPHRARLRARSDRTRIGAISSMKYAIIHKLLIFFSTKARLLALPARQTCLQQIRSTMQYTSLCCRDGRTDRAKTEELPLPPWRGSAATWGKDGGPHACCQRRRADDP